MDRSGPNTIDSDAGVEATEPETTLEGDSYAGAPRPEYSEEILSRGATVGRYTVLEKIGSGGMGVVYAAFDPQLDRKVALKLMHPGSRGSDHSRGGRQRLLREAQAMAKLSHPNVITVHDVGTYGERVFVAMEFIEGCTLRSWIASQPREWSDVVDAFVEAGRGLAAAHAAGLVHRDFKPDNVLMGLTGANREQHDGRVIVMDFGLARQASARAARTVRDPDRIGADRIDQELQLTRTGALLGTPAYMAPEQHKNGPVGPAADQFSFCVALWEALYGERPFGGTNVTSVAMNVLEGRIRPPPRDAQVPTWLRDVLTRGLSVAPSDRYASMDALLAELQRDPPQSNRPWLVAAVAAASATGIVAVYLISSSAEEPACDDAQEQLALVWDEARNGRVFAALTTPPLAYAEVGAQSTITAVDAYAARWARVYGEVCSMSRRSRRAGPTNGARETGMRCVEERLGELDALLDVYTFEPDATVVDRAVEAALALEPPERCLDLGGHDADDDTARTRRIASELAGARALLLTGRASAALERATPLADLAASAEAPKREAEVLLVIADAHVANGELTAAERSLRRAIQAASAAGSDEIEATAWIRMVDIVGLRHHDIVHARRLALAAESLIARAGNPPRLRADLLVLLGAMHLAEGHESEALRDFEQALSLRRDHLGANPLATAAASEGMGIALDGLRRHTEAIEHLTSVLSTREQLLGTQHPSCGLALSHLGAAMLGAHEVRRATATLIRARMILDPEGDPVLEEIAEPGAATASTPGVDAASQYDRNLAVALDRLGLVLRATEKLEAASRLHSQAAAMMTTLPENSRDLAYPLGNLGLALTELGRADEALPPLQQALQLAESTLAPTHPDRALFHLNLANASWALGDFETAGLHYDHARRIWEDMADDHPLLAYALTGLGRARLSADDAPGAVEVLDRAFELRDDPHEDAINVAETSLLLARALWATQRNSQRALELAAETRDLVKATEPTDASDLERLLSGAEVVGLSDQLVPAGLGLIDRRHLPR